MIASLPPLKPSERAAAARGIPAAPRGAGALAAKHQAFDLAAAERAEIEREHEALQTMLMAWLKNEDEIMKKWIALI